MRVVTLGGIGQAMPYLSPSPQPYFIADESWNQYAAGGGMKGFGDVVAEEVRPAWANILRVAITVSAGAAVGYYFGRRSRR